MPKSKSPPPKCRVCKKELELIIGDAEIIRAKKPPFKIRGWQKRPTGEWLCPDPDCKHIFLMPKEPPYMLSEGK